MIGIFKVVRANLPPARRAILRAKDVLDRLGDLRVVRGVIAETTKRLHELAHEVHVPRSAFHVAPRVREMREEKVPLASPILAAEAISTPRRRGEYLVGDEVGVRLEIGSGANILHVLFRAHVNLALARAAHVVRGVSDEFVLDAGGFEEIRPDERDGEFGEVGLARARAATLVPVRLRAGQVHAEIIARGEPRDVGQELFAETLVRHAHLAEHVASLVEEQHVLRAAPRGHLRVELQPVPRHAFRRARRELPRGTARRGDAEVMERHQNVAGPVLEERLGQKRLAVDVRDARANRPVAIRQTKPGQRETRAVGIVVQKRLVRIAVHGHRGRGAIVVGAVPVFVRGRVDAAHRAPRRQVELKHERRVVLRAIFLDASVVLRATVFIRVRRVAPVAARRRGGEGHVRERRDGSDGVFVFAVVLVFFVFVSAERRSPARHQRGDVEHGLHAPRKRRRVEHRVEHRFWSVRAETPLERSDATARGRLQTPPRGVRRVVVGVPTADVRVVVHRLVAAANRGGTRHGR